jgi:hypothetical protein
MTRTPPLADAAAPREERYPVAPDTVTVLGCRWKATEPAWQGLDFTKARLRTQSTLMLFVVGPNDAPYDLHLDVPFCHPNDQPEGWDDETVYRVRPIAAPGRKWRGKMVEAVAIEPAPGMDPPWQIVVRFAPRRQLVGARQPEARRGG